MLNAHARNMLADRYTVGDETPEDIFRRVATYYGTDDAHSKRLLSYMERMWFVPATPILANGGTGRGLPISCFLNMVPDSREGIIDHIGEMIWMATSGGGVGADWSEIRSAGQKTSRGTVTTGAIQYMHILDAATLASNQGKTRQGSYASYININHPEVIEHINMRRPSGGDAHRKNLNIHHGINITDDFMTAVVEDADWYLVDPNSKQVTETIKARELWQMIIETRLLTGEPYLHFVDRSNEKLHPDLKALGYKVRGSNLCSEITLPTEADRSAICCLSSLNVELFDEWEDDPLFIGDIMEFLDNVITDFAKNAPEHLWRAVKSALGERSVGLGQMGFHSFLQKHMVPIESPAARGWNNKIAKNIYERAMEANLRLAEERGPALDLKGHRFAHMIAIAPNASTSLIAGTSPSIEPWNSNAFSQKTISGIIQHRNKYLDDLIRTKVVAKLTKERLTGKTSFLKKALSAFRVQLGGSPMSSDEEVQVEVDKVWQSIIQNQGSVQHLTSLLTDWERDVFKTAMEIDQRTLVKLAADRQHYVCQAQSLNFFFPSSAPLEYINDVHMLAWLLGLKTCYYVRTQAVRTGSMVTFDADKECQSCSA